jgi:hypothetical protein
MGFQASCAPHLMIYRVSWCPDGRRTAGSSGSTIERPRVANSRARTRAYSAALRRSAGDGKRNGGRDCLELLALLRLGVDGTATTRRFRPAARATGGPAGVPSGHLPAMQVGEAAGVQNQPAQELLPPVGGVPRASFSDAAVSPGAPLPNNKSRREGGGGEGEKPWPCA